MPSTRPPLRGMFPDHLHERGKPSDGTGAQVVAVGESARQHHHITAFEVGVGVPEGDRLSPNQLDRVGTVAVAPGARKDGDAEAQAQAPGSTVSSKR